MVDDLSSGDKSNLSSVIHSIDFYQEKIEAFVNSPKQKISDFLTLLPTVKFNEYNDLVTRFNNIVAELPTIPPTDPVRLARVGAELISVLNDFSTLSFLRPDIVTD